MLDLLGPLVFGLVGSLHCLGMCGPLVLAYSLHLNPSGQPQARIWPQSAFHHAAFHAGRLLTYGLLGALAGAIASLSGLQQAFAGLRTGATIAGGVIMLVLGLGLLGVLPARFFSIPAWGSSNVLARQYSSHLSTSYTAVSKFVLGFLSGFLPCMLSFAMIVKAAATGHMVTGFLTMLLFGLGTVPILYGVGISASALSVRVRCAGERVAGGMVVVMGAILILKAARHII